MSEQPEALRLADALEKHIVYPKKEKTAASLIRRQHARIEADEALMRTAAHLLKRYVSETPLGNQPHMITLEADAAITALRSRLETK